MVIRNFVNRKVGLSTDVKPVATAMFPIIFYEEDTGKTFTSTDGLTLTTIQSNDKTEVIQNKIINPEKNTLSNLNLIEDSPFMLNAYQKGGHIPAATNSGSFFGGIEGGASTVLSNPLKPTVIEGVGVVCEYNNSTANNLIGWRTATPFTRMTTNVRTQVYMFEVMGDASRILLGFSDQTAPNASFGLDVTDSGVMMGFTKVDTNFCVYNNDGTGSAVKTMLPVQKDSQYHLYEIDLSIDGSIICKFDATYQVTIASRIPDVTDNLYLMAYGIV